MRQLLYAKEALATKYIMSFSSNLCPPLFLETLVFPPGFFHKNPPDNYKANQAGMYDPRLMVQLKQNNAQDHKKLTQKLIVLRLFTAGNSRLVLLTDNATHKQVIYQSISA